MKRLGLVAGVALGLLAVLILTLLVFRLPVLESLRLLGEGALGSRAGISRSLVKATPLLLTSLGMIVAWKAGMYNIGGEGQFIMGGLFGAVVAKAGTGLSPLALNASILVATLAGGALFAGLAAWLQIKRGVQVVISTILLNFVAIQLLAWAVSGPLQESKKQLPQTDPLPDAAMLLRFDRQLDLHAGLFVALVAAVLLWVALYSTSWGFRLRLCGANPRVARANRIPVERVQLGAMMVSGGLCGLAGGVEYTGISGQLGTAFSQNWGFLGIPVALLGGLHPIGAIGSSTYFGALFAGAQNLAAFTSVGTSIVYVIQAVAVLAFIGLLWVIERRRASQVVEDQP